MTIVNLQKKVTTHNDRPFHKIMKKRKKKKLYACNRTDDSCYELTIRGLHIYNTIIKVEMAEQSIIFQVFSETK